MQAPSPYKSQRMDPEVFDDGMDGEEEVTNRNCIANYTPHKLDIKCTDGVVRSWESRGTIVAKWKDGSFNPETTLLLTPKMGIPVYAPPVYNCVEGLDFDENTPSVPDIVVSEITARNLPAWVYKRCSVYTPNTNPGHVTRHNGQIVYVDSLIRWNK